MISYISTSSRVTNVVIRRGPSYTTRIRQTHKSGTLRRTNDGPLRSVDKIWALRSLTLFSDDSLAVLWSYVKLAWASPSIEPTLVHHVLVEKYMWYLTYFKRTHQVLSSSRSKKILDPWIDIAAKLNIVQLLGRSDSAAQNRFIPSWWKACHFSGCICSDMHPFHKLMVCKGCWNVKYCCREC